MPYWNPHKKSYVSGKLLITEIFLIIHWNPYNFIHKSHAPHKFNESTFYTRKLTRDCYETSSGIIFFAVVQIRSNQFHNIHLQLFFLVEMSEDIKKCQRKTFTFGSLRTTMRVEWILSESSRVHLSYEEIHFDFINLHILGTWVSLRAPKENSSNVFSWAFSGHVKKI